MEIVKSNETTNDLEAVTHTCTECGQYSKSAAGLAAHKRAKHPIKKEPVAPITDIPTVSTEPQEPTVEAKAPLPTPKMELEDKPIKKLPLKQRILERLKVKEGRVILVGYVVSGAAIFGSVAAAVVNAGNIAAGYPFLPLFCVAGVMLLASRKDVPFNLRLLILKVLKQNPRIIYHIDGSRTITRTAEKYDPYKGTVTYGRGNKGVEIEWTPDAQCIDNARTIAAGIHIGREKHLCNLFSDAGDYFTPRQVDMMIKDAEQLGELKSTDKLDKLVTVGYIIGACAVIGLAINVITWTSVGELVDQVGTLITLVETIPISVENLLGR